MRKPTILEFLTNTPIINGSKIKLRQKCIQDAVNEYHWRKDDELCRLDASTPIAGSFQEYIHWYSDDHGYSNNARLLSIETLDGDHIGNCGCFHIDDVEKELEIGILIGEKDYWDQGYGMDVVKTLIDTIFENTYAHRIYLKTLNWNTRAQKCFQKCGFSVAGKIINGEHTFFVMEIKRASNLSGSVTP